MIRIRAFLCVSLVMCIAGCATAPPSGDKTITVKADRVAQCKAQGGCGLFTRAEILQMLNEAVQAGATAAMADLDSQGCRRGGS